MTPACRALFFTAAARLLPPFFDKPLTIAARLTLFARALLAGLTLFFVFAAFFFEPVFLPRVAMTFSLRRSIDRTNRAGAREHEKVVICAYSPFAAHQCV